MKPFKVIQDHRFRYQWQAVCNFICVNNSNFYRFRDMADYWSNFRPRQGVPLFNALVGDLQEGEPLNLEMRNLASGI